METMNYYTNSNIGLPEIEQFAVSFGYKTWFYPEGKETLYIQFGTEHQMRWEWSVNERSELSIEDMARERLEKLNPTTVLTFEYYPKWLPEVVGFMRTVLEKYGGWLDCLGDVEQMYTIKDVEGIISGCP
jgi:hypothetical protein